MVTKIGINGFGRIGTLVLRAGLGNPNLDFVAVNDMNEPDLLAYMFEFNSVHGTYKGSVEARDKAIVINGKEIKVFSSAEPAKIPWRDVGVDLVIESTGRFESKDAAAGHLQAGAKKVIITAPAKGVEATLVMGVNHNVYDPQKYDIVAMGSCTTYAIATALKVINNTFGIKKGFMNTAHAYTNTQALLDKPSKDPRRSRAAAINIVPTTTGAAVAIGKVIPELDGKIDGLSLRVPVPDGSIVDLTLVLEREVNVDMVHQAFRDAGKIDPVLGKILTVSDKPLVSSDIIGTSQSSIIDASQTLVKGDLVKVLCWYDNEWSFAMRVVELAEHVVTKGVQTRAGQRTA